MSEQKGPYTRKVFALRTLESRKLGRGSKCSLLGRSDGYYQVIFKKDGKRFYLVDNITQYDKRIIEDAYYRIRTLEDFEREREELILEPGEEESIRALKKRDSYPDNLENERDFEGDLDDGSDGEIDFNNPFAYADNLRRLNDD